MSIVHKGQQINIIIIII